MKTMPHVLTKWLIALAIGSVVSQSCAQAAEVNAMDAGAIAQKISPPKQLEGQTENLTSETTAPMVRIQVSAWKVTGNSVFDSATLLNNYALATNLTSLNNNVISPSSSLINNLISSVGSLNNNIHNVYSTRQIINLLGDSSLFVNILL
jgi:hypothetical protein